MKKIADLKSQGVSVSRNEEPVSEEKEIEFTQTFLERHGGFQGEEEEEKMPDFTQTQEMRNVVSESEKSLEYLEAQLESHRIKMEAVQVEVDKQIHAGFF